MLQKIQAVGDYVPNGFIMHELQKVLIKKKLHRCRKLLIGLPKLQDHIDVLKNGYAVRDISLSSRHTS